jgi:hypothetical protein
MNRKEQILKWGMRFLLLLLCYSGIQKLVAPEAFHNALLKTAYLRLSLIPSLSILIPVLELAAAFMLIFSKTRILAIRLSLFLMTAFTSHLILIYNFSPGTPCSCGGLFEFMNFPTHLLFNFVIILWLIYASMSEREIHELTS